MKINYCKSNFQVSTFNSMYAIVVPMVPDYDVNIIENTPICQIPWYQIMMCTIQSIVHDKSAMLHGHGHGHGHGDTAIFEK